MSKKTCRCGHKSAGIPKKLFDEKEVNRGAIIEFEHTCDKEKAKQIARDHLTESPFYYEELEKMEMKLDKINESKNIKLPKVNQKICPPNLKNLMKSVNKK